MKLNLKTKLNMEKTRTEMIIFEAIRDFEEETGFIIREIAIGRPNSSINLPIKAVKVSV